MTIEICKKCNAKFSCEEIGGGGPFKKELADITCLECGDTRKEWTTGYFKVGPAKERKSKR